MVCVVCSGFALSDNPPAPCEGHAQFHRCYPTQVPWGGQTQPEAVCRTEVFPLPPFKRQQEPRELAILRLSSAFSPRGQEVTGVGPPAAPRGWALWHPQLCCWKCPALPGEGTHLRLSAAEPLSPCWKGAGQRQRCGGGIAALHSPQRGSAA